jgi:proteasome assembly chaperone (PAC2) family protein
MDEHEMKEAKRSVTGYSAESCTAEYTENRALVNKLMVASMIEVFSHFIEPELFFNTESLLDLYTESNNFFFHTSAQCPVTCVTKVTINTVYATLFIHYPVFEDIIFIATCFGSVGPSSRNISK